MGDNKETKYTVRNISDYQIDEIHNLIAWGEDVSDGHHTMNELYEHRHALFIALCKIYDNYITPLGSNVKCWKSKLHDDGTMFDGWFLMGMTVTKPQFSGPSIKLDIAYHLPIRYWHLAKVIELEKGPPYDGYTSEDVRQRILNL